MNQTTTPSTAGSATDIDLDTEIEELSLKHIAVNWNLAPVAGYRSGDYKDTLQFKRLKAFTVDLLARRATPQHPRPTDDELWDATLRDRDQYHEWADKLAEAISKYFDAYIGEHSNTNCPWAEALEAIEAATPQHPGDLRERFDSTYLSLNGFHTKAELTHAWGALAGDLFRAGTAATPQHSVTEQAQPALTVWYGPMPESNGKSNFTAVLMRKDAGWDGPHVTIERGEYPDRIRYEADRVRHLIGEISEEPDILAYDANKHSGYVKPDRAQPLASTAATQPEHASIPTWQERSWAHHPTDPEDHVPQLLAEIADLRAALAIPASTAPAAAVRAAERIDAMHKGVVGVFAAIKAEHEASTAATQPEQASFEAWCETAKGLPAFDPRETSAAIRALRWARAAWVARGAATRSISLDTILECYSPDDTVHDYQDKIRALFTSYAASTGPSSAPAGLDERERFIWQMGHSAALAIPASTAATQPEQASVLSDNECDEAAAKALDRIAAKHDMHALHINADVREHDDLRRELIRAGAALAIPASTAPKPADWRGFIESCAQASGGMVNGNRLAMQAKALLASTAASEQQASDEWSDERIAAPDIATTAADQQGERCDKCGWRASSADYCGERDCTADQQGDTASESESQAGIVGASLDSYSPEDQAFFKFWYSHMKDEVMQAPLSETWHSTARYIWDAAIAQQGAAQAQAGDVARDAARYRWLMQQVPSNIADIFEGGSISTVDQLIDEEIDAKRAAMAAPATSKGKP